MAGFVKGSRERARARIAIDGPPGAGKSVTALRFAACLGKRIAVIDSERRSALLYHGMEFDGEALEFDHMELTTFSPAEYTSAIAQATGYDVLVIDSLSHAWEGIDGVLELVDKLAVKGNKFVGWTGVTPLHRRMVDAILSFPGHVVCTVRSKIDHVQEKDGDGKTVIRKVGMRPIQREGMEYEFTMYASMDEDHFIRVTKSRCSGMDGAVGHKPGKAFLLPFVGWLEKGTAPAADVPRIAMVTDAQAASIRQLTLELGLSSLMAGAEFMRRFRVEHIHQLTGAQAGEIIGLYRGRLADKQKSSLGTEAAGAVQPLAQAAVDQQGGEAQTLQEAMVATAQAADTPQTNGTPSPIATQGQLGHLIQVRESYFALLGHGDSVRDKAWRDETWKTILAKRGVTTATKLSVADCDTLIGNMEAKVSSLTSEHQAIRQAARDKETAAAKAAAEPPKS